MKKLFQSIMIILFSAVFVLCAYKIITIYAGYSSGISTYESAVKSFFSSNSLNSSQSEGQNSDNTSTAESAPIAINFSGLKEISDDVIGWLFCPDTMINYPVVQGDDNAYYLYKLYDGTKNGSGSLFLDYRNSSGLSDKNSIIYGHHMKNGTMFASLTNYKDQSYYDEHPVIYLLTPDQNYKIEIFAGIITSSTSYVYTREFGSDFEMNEYISKAVSESTFQTGVQVSSSDTLITLSTCSYEYDDARYAIIGKLTEIN